MNRPANRPRPWEAQADRESVSFGQWLRRQREMRGVDLREIADITKISLRYLQALERDQFDVLPAPIFARGFLREYAKYVGLDPDEVVNSYLSAQQELSPAEDEIQVVPVRPSSAGRWTFGVLMGVGLVAVLGLVGYLAFYAETSRPEIESQAPPIAAPLPEAPTRSDVVASPDAGPDARTVAEGAEAAEAAADLPPLRVTLDFTEDCWVEVVLDETTRLSELRVQGESLQLDAERSVRLTLGNPGGVRVEVNGEPYPLEVRTGRVARDILIEAPADGAGAG